MINTSKLKEDLLKDKKIIINKRNPNIKYSKETRKEYLINKQKYLDYKCKQGNYIEDIHTKVYTSIKNHEKIIRKNNNKIIYFDHNFNIYFRYIPDHYFIYDVKHITQLYRLHNKNKQDFMRYFLQFRP